MVMNHKKLYRLYREEGLAVRRRRGRKREQNPFIESFNGSLRDECLNEEIFESLADARRKLALWRYDYNNVRPNSSLGNRTHADARRALGLVVGSAPGALAKDSASHYHPSGLSS